MLGVPGICGECPVGLIMRGSWKTLAQMLLRGPIGILLGCSTISPGEEGRKGREAVDEERRTEREREIEHLWPLLLLSSGPLSLGSEKAGDCSLAPAGQELCRHGEALRVGANFRLGSGRRPPLQIGGLGARRGPEGVVCGLQSLSHSFPPCCMALVKSLHLSKTLVFLYVNAS